jgi:hypothetical protein
MKFKAVTTLVAALTAASLAISVGTALASPLENTTAASDPGCVSGRCSSAATNGSPATGANDATVTAPSPGELALIRRHHALGRLGTPLPVASRPHAPIQQAPAAVADGVDWGAVAIGAAAAVALIGIAVASVALRRRRSVVVQSASQG